MLGMAKEAGAVRQRRHLLTLGVIMGNVRRRTLISERILLQSLDLLSSTCLAKTVMPQRYSSASGRSGS